MWRGGTEAVRSPLSAGCGRSGWGRGAGERGIPEERIGAGDQHGGPWSPAVTLRQGPGSPLPGGSGLGILEGSVGLRRGREGALREGKLWAKMGSVRTPAVLEAEGPGEGGGERGSPRVCMQTRAAWGLSAQERKAGLGGRVKVRAGVGGGAGVCKFMPGRGRSGHRAARSAE